MLLSLVKHANQQLGVQFIPSPTGNKTDQKLPWKPQLKFDCYEFVVPNEGGTQYITNRACLAYMMYRRADPDDINS